MEEKKREKAKRKKDDAQISDFYNLKKILERILQYFVFLIKQIKPDVYCESEIKEDNVLRLQTLTYF